MIKCYKILLIENSSGNNRSHSDQIRVQIRPNIDWGVMNQQIQIKYIVLLAPQKLSVDYKQWKSLTLTVTMQIKLTGVQKIWQIFSAKLYIFPLAWN